MVQSVNYSGFQPPSALNINAHNLEETCKLWEQKFGKQRKHMMKLFTHLLHLCITEQNHVIWVHKKSLIRDRLVLGCLDQRLPERLQRETDLTLKKAINLGRIAETTKEKLKTLQMETNSNVCVLTPAKRDINIKSCSHCGAKHALLSCPAYGKQCNIFGKSNHLPRCAAAVSLACLHQAEYINRLQNYLLQFVKIIWIATNL